jgi:hypothetical protein
LGEFGSYEGQKKITKQTFPTQLLHVQLKKGLDANIEEHRVISKQLVV